jgi:hypothetical protein
VIDPARSPLQRPHRALLEVPVERASRYASGEAVERIQRQDRADAVLVFDLAAVRGQVIEAP